MMLSMSSMAMALIAAAARAVAVAPAAMPDFSITSGKLSSWNQSDWSLTTTRFLPGHYQSRIGLSNGYVGASVAAAGPFFEMDVKQTGGGGGGGCGGEQAFNGWPLYSPRIAFSTISGFYNIQQRAEGTNHPWLGQYGWDSFIAGIPHPTAIVFAFGGELLDAAAATDRSVSGFEQRLSMRDGVAQWAYTWRPRHPSVGPLDVSFALIFSRARPNVVACRATIRALSDVNGTVTDLLDGRSAARSYLETKGIVSRANETSVHAAVHPEGLPDVTAWVVSMSDFASAGDRGPGRPAGSEYGGGNESTVGQTFDISLAANRTATFTKFVGVASTDKFPRAESVARAAAAAARADGWDQLLDEHTRAWRELMAADAVDDYSDPATGELPDDANVRALQVASVASTFYLLQNLRPDDGSGLNDNSVPVGGLVSDSYGGQVFWDADTWMAPGLNLAFPDYGKQIANLRVKQHGQAVANAALNGLTAGSSLYPWTTGRYGNCTATGPCVDYEYHVNYDVALNILQLLSVTRNESWFAAGPEAVVVGAARMTAGLLRYNESEGRYWLRNATDPDEYANNVDNPSFTLASAVEVLRRANRLLVARGAEANATWADMADKAALPRAPSGITLEYQTMNNSVKVKQADVVLLTYPLGYRRDYTPANALLDLDYYSVKQSPDGPAMTFSAFAAAANEVSPSGCAAYTYALKGLLPYLRGPWYQFSEQMVDDPALNGGTRPAFPFLTGHGGALQMAPFGFLGLRTDRDALRLSPSLPPQLSHLRLRRFFFAGAAFEATMNTTHTALRRMPPPAGLNGTAYAGEALPVVAGAPDDGAGERTWMLRVNETVVIPNRLYWRNKTRPGNLLQCLPVASDDEYVAGQLPESAIDGAAATSWQPRAGNASASIFVDTSGLAPRRVAGLWLDFGARPVANLTVWFYNETDGLASGLAVRVGGLGGVGSVAGTETVAPVEGNTTTVPLDGQLDVWTGDRVKLSVEGCAGCGGSDDNAGGTVAEFVVY